MVTGALKSCLYVGTVRHRRFSPRPHAFRYPLFMVLLDLDEPERAFRGRWLWSAHHPNLAWFRSADHLDGSRAPLADAVRTLVRERTGQVLAGPVRLLTHLRTFGYCFNPISLYFCYGPDGQSVAAVVAEVTNTPWGERYCYVLAAPAAEGEAEALHRVAQNRATPRLHFRFEKALHVSPFLEMDYLYDMRLNEPGATLTVHLENWRLSSASARKEKVLDATLMLQRRPMTGTNLAWVLLRYPFLTARVMAAIYAQALKLWWKGLPIVAHPDRGALSTPS